MARTGLGMARTGIGSVANHGVAGLVPKVSKYIAGTNVGKYGLAGAASMRLKKITEGAASAFGTGLGRMTGATARGIATPAIVAGKAGVNIAAENVSSLGSFVSRNVKDTVRRVPNSSFNDQAKSLGFTKVNPKGVTEVDTKAAVHHYDKLKRTQGLDAANNHFNGYNPNWLQHRGGFGKVTDLGFAAVGVGEIQHKGQVKGNLIPNAPVPNSDYKY